MDDIGIHLLDPKSPLLPAGTFQHTEVKVDHKIYDRYLGRYERLTGSLGKQVVAFAGDGQGDFGVETTIGQLPFPCCLSSH